MGRSLVSGSTTPSSTFHGHSQNKDRARHCIQGNTGSTSIGFPHGDSEGSSIIPHSSFLVALFFLRFFQFHPHPNFCNVEKKLCSFSLNIFLFRHFTVANLQHAPYSFFLSYTKQKTVESVTNTTLRSLCSLWIFFITYFILLQTAPLYLGQIQ